MENLVKKIHFFSNCNRGNIVLNETCYMCDEKATSMEHVPPKCLFPEAKEMDGKDYRADLITVPSCDAHNGKKSQDDEFLMVSIAGIIGNNSIGYRHQEGKIHRALKRSSFKLLNKVFLKKTLYRFEREDNKFIDVLWGTPDYNRLINCFSHIAYGIYRHHFSENFKGKIKPFLGFLHSNKKNPETFKKFIKHKANDELAEQPFFGKNKEVFYYQFTAPDQFGVFLVKLCFYEGTEVFVALMPESSKQPTSLLMQLMNEGFKTIVTHGGKEYEFN